MMILQWFVERRSRRLMQKSAAQQNLPAWLSLRIRATSAQMTPLSSQVRYLCYRGQCPLAAGQCFAPRPQHPLRHVPTKAGIRNRDAVAELSGFAGNGLVALFQIA